MFVCIDKSCDLAQRTLCLLSIQETRRAGREGQSEGGREGGVDGERQGGGGGGEKHTAAKSSCVSPPATSTGAGSISTRLTSVPAAPRSFGAQCQQVIKSVQPPTEGGKKMYLTGKNSASSLRAGRGRSGECGGGKKQNKTSPVLQSEAANQTGANGSVLTAIKRAAAALQGHELFTDF